MLVSVGLPGFVNDLFRDAVENIAKIVAAAGSLFGDDDGPKQSPVDRTNEVLFGPDRRPPAAPAPEGEGSGLDAGAGSAGDQYNDNVDAASLTDEKLAELLKQIFASNQAARDKVFAILTEIQTKQQQIGPELGDPASVTAFQQFIDQKFGEIQKLLADAQIDARTQAAILEALGDEYASTGTDGGAGGGPSDSGGGSGGDDPGTTIGADPAAGGNQLMDPLAGMGPLGGPTGLDPLAAMGPALAGLGSLPAAMGGLAGGGTPLDALGPALSSLAQLGGLASGFTDDEPRPDDVTKPEDGFTDEPPTDEEGQPPSGDPADALHDEDGEGEAVSASPAAEQTASTASPGEQTPVQAAPSSAPAEDAARNVTLPDGQVVTAPDPQAASVMRSVLSGTGVTEAFKQVGVELPPPGTPVTDPVDPAQMPPASVGRFESREPVMAMGNGKIWMDGQLQPVGALGSSSDFLGWSKPPTSATTTVTPAAPAAP